MLSTKNYNNNSSLFANTAKFNKLECDEAIISNYDTSFQNVYAFIQYVYTYIINYYYDKTYIDTNYYTKFDSDTNYYTKTQSDNNYYTKL